MSVGRTLVSLLRALWLLLFVTAALTALAAQLLGTQFGTAIGVILHALFVYAAHAAAIDPQGRHTPLSGAFSRPFVTAYALIILLPLALGVGAEALVLIRPVPQTTLIASLVLILILPLTSLSLFGTELPRAIWRNKRPQEAAIRHPGRPLSVLAQLLFWNAIVLLFMVAVIFAYQIVVGPTQGAQNPAFQILEAMLNCATHLACDLASAAVLSRAFLTTYGLEK